MLLRIASLGVSAARATQLHTCAAAAARRLRGNPPVLPLADIDSSTTTTQSATLVAQPLPAHTPGELLAQLRAWAHAGRGAVPPHVGEGPRAGSAPAWPRARGAAPTRGAAPALRSRAAQAARAARAGAGAPPVDRPPLPPSFAGDAERVAHGHKRLLGDASVLSFACTGCGACCRSFADTVLCDPADLWRMGQAPALARAPEGRGEPAPAHGGSPSVGAHAIGPCAPGSPVALRPTAFRFQLGHFSTAALPAGVSLPGWLETHGATHTPASAAFRARVSAACAQAGLPTTDAQALALSRCVPTRSSDDAGGAPTLEGLLPVVFLRSRPAGASDSDVAAAIAAGRDAEAPSAPRRRSGGSGGDGGGRTRGRRRPGAALGSLSFSLGWQRGRGPWDAHLQCGFAVPIDALPGRAGVPVGPRRPPRPGGLACSLGPAHMPTSCALYPLGDLWSSPAPPAGGPTAAVPATASAAAPAAATERVHFYSLDHRRCEGVAVEGLGSPAPRAPAGPSALQHAALDAADPQRPAPGATSSTVAAYRARNDLASRRAGGDWFMALASAIVVLAPDQVLAAGCERLEAAAVEAVAQAARVCSDDDSSPPPAPASMPAFLRRLLRALAAQPSSHAADEASSSGRRRLRPASRTTAALPQPPGVAAATDAAASRPVAAAAAATAPGGMRGSPLSPHAVAGILQERLRRVLYYQHPHELDADPLAGAGGVEAGAQQQQQGQPGQGERAGPRAPAWAPMRRRIEATAISSVLAAVEAAEACHAHAEALDAWTLEARRAAAAGGVAAQPPLPQLSWRVRSAQAAVQWQQCAAVSHAVAALIAQDVNEGGGAGAPGSEPGTASDVGAAWLAAGLRGRSFC